MQSLKILAVDNSATMRRIIVNTLKRAGYSDITEACDGKDALVKLKAGRYQFVITDWDMPEMDGLTFVSRLRSSERFKDIPVLMVTNRSVKEDIVAAMRAGVNSYIVKPFAADTLHEKIQQVIKEVGGE